MKELQTSYETGRILTGARAVIERFKIICFMGLGEFSPIPYEGVNLINEIDEGNTEITRDRIKRQIIATANKHFPELQILQIKVSR